MRLGLVANHLHHSHPKAALFRWLHRCETGIRELNLGLHTVGGTHDAIARAGCLTNYPALRRYPSGHEGGLVKLVAGIVGAVASNEVLDGAIYLVNPVDGSSLFPEALALKRQCIVHQKPFLSTVASACDWVEIERIRAGMKPDDGADPLHAMPSQTIAMIAHDAMKAPMMAFADKHFDLLSRFAFRVATGTTGKSLNELARKHGWPEEASWVTCYESGPMGGDAQIANLIFERRCQRLLFFENPHVPHQHEADIQLLERAVAATTDDTVCITCPASAIRWAEAAERRARLRPLRVDYVAGKD
ncbi:methylglyoxal synthase [Luteibacter rhizovicinus]|uniref:Methylglyoxal synthase n=1 Tax=Luteibacter rhizovicinus TaxID=242606 RepID=A0A4R3YR73_9GAMM|nr:methylglyoxal synthase [Luteibacter rhizovicinus]TCV94940.1 methylglyoxal synthase [Luteibacter rhizovicinus]